MNMELFIILLLTTRTVRILLGLYFTSHNQNDLARQALTDISPEVLDKLLFVLDFRPLFITFQGRESFNVRRGYR